MHLLLGGVRVRVGCMLLGVVWRLILNTLDSIREAVMLLFIISLVDKTTL